jgi:hypothetical protein
MGVGSFFCPLLCRNDRTRCVVRDVKLLKHFLSQKTATLAVRIHPDHIATSIMQHHAWFRGRYSSVINPPEDYHYNTVRPHAAVWTRFVVRQCSLGDTPTYPHALLPMSPLSKRILKTQSV